MSGDEVRALADTLRAAGVEIGAAGGEAFRLALAQRLLGSHWLAAVKADVWDEACEHDVATCRTRCEHNPYRSKT